MKTFTPIAVYLFAILTFAAVPDSMRFVSDERQSGGILQVLSWTRIGDTFTVKLQKAAPMPSETVLLTEARCQEVAIGYHCFIKPVRRRGILITDVSLVRTLGAYFDANKIMLIDGSMTSMMLIGHDFVPATSDGPQLSIQK